MVSWLAPDAVWKECTVATGMPGGNAAACEAARVHDLALVQRRVRRHEVRRHGVARALPVDDAGELVARAERHADLGLAVGDQLDHAGVVERLDHLPDQPAGADDRVADVDAVGAALVEGDGGGEVRRVLVDGLAVTVGERSQVGQVLRAAVSSRSWFVLEVLFALRGAQLPDGLLQLLVLRSAREP